MEGDPETAQKVRADVTALPQGNLPFPSSSLRPAPGVRFTSRVCGQAWLSWNPRTRGIPAQSRNLGRVATRQVPGGWGRVTDNVGPADGHWTFPLRPVVNFKQPRPERLNPAGISRESNPGRQPPPLTGSRIRARRPFIPTTRTPVPLPPGPKNPELQLLLHRDPRILALSPLQTLGTLSLRTQNPILQLCLSGPQESDSQPLTLLGPSGPHLQPLHYLGDSVAQTAGPQGPGLGAAPASLLTRGAAAGSPILGPASREFLNLVWHRPS